MDIWAIVLIALSLAADAFAVSLTNGLTYTRPRASVSAAFFGVFQGLMPLGGYYLGTLFAAALERYAGVVTLIILGFIGIKMLVEGLRPPNADDKKAVSPSLKTIAAQAVATSIDAFAVGLSLSAMRADIFLTCGLIAVITAGLSYLAVGLGKRFGKYLGSRAQVIGGAILIIIGIKSLFS